MRRLQGVLPPRRPADALHGREAPTRPRSSRRHAPLRRGGRTPQAQRPLHVRLGPQVEALPREHHGMSWSRRFRIREYVRGSLWILPLLGARLAAFVGFVVAEADGGSADLDRASLAESHVIGSTRAAVAAHS